VLFGEFVTSDVKLLGECEEIVWSIVVRVAVNVFPEGLALEAPAVGL
jgi:hypothetical protein